MSSTFRLDGCAANRSLNTDRRQIKHNTNHNTYLGRLRSRSISLAAEINKPSEEALTRLKKQFRVPLRRRFSEPALKYTEHQPLSDRLTESSQLIGSIVNNTRQLGTKTGNVAQPKTEPIFHWFDQQGRLSCQQTKYLLSKLHQHFQRQACQDNPTLIDSLVGLQQLTDQLGQSSDSYLNTVDLESLYQLLDLTCSVLPKGELQELTQLLAVQVRLQGLLATKETLKAELCQQLKKFEQPGASSQVNLELELSAGAGLFGLDLLSGKLSMNLGFQILTDDDSGMLELHTSGLKLGLQVGTKMTVEGFAIGEGDAGIMLSDSSLPDFVSRYVDNLMGTLLTAATSRSIRHLKGWQNNKAFQKIQQEALTGQHRLNNLLLKYGVTGQVEAQTAPPRVMTCRCKLLQGKFSAGVKLFHRIFQGNYHKTYLDIDVLSKQPLVDSLKQDSSRIFRFNHQYYTPSIDRVAKLQEQGSEAVALPERAKQVIDELEAEFRHYSQLVQFCDYGKKNPRQVNKQQLHQARQTKASFETSRKVKGREEYTRTITIAYAALHQLYQASASIDQKNSHLSSFNQFEKILQRPSFHVSERSFTQKLSFGVRSLLKRTYEGGTLKLSLPAEHAALSLDITHFNTKEHPNYYRKGQFLDVTVGLNGYLGLSDLLDLLASERVAFSSIKDIIQANDSQADVSAEGISDQLSEALTNVGDLALNASTSLQFRLKQIKPGNQWALQFIRLGTHTGFNVSTPTANIPIVPGVNSGVKGKIKSNETTIRKEWLGSNTLSYLLPIHNTLQGANQSQRWQQFTEQHEQAFKKLFFNMVKTNTVANQEMLDLLAEIKNDDLQARFKLALTRFTQFKTPTNYQQAVSIFNEFLTAQVDVYKVKSLNECWDA